MMAAAQEGPGEVSEGLLHIPRDTYQEKKNDTGSVDVFRSSWKPVHVWGTGS